MASRKGINAQRLKTIYLRQMETPWDDRYMPSILATPQEAPSVSRATILMPSKFNRELHLLSSHETAFTLLGTYHPNTVGLQEARMLSADPRPHPLWTFPGIDRNTLPYLKGVIDVAERLGYLDRLPRISIADSQDSGQSFSMVFPWVGDLLWAIKLDERVYCVNWTVKATAEDFDKTTLKRNHTLTSAEEIRNALARHEIEQVYYADAGIRTVRVTGDRLDRHVAANLRQLFLHHSRSLSLNSERREEIVQKFHSALDLGIPPSEVIRLLMSQGCCTLDQGRSLLYQVIWNRELRVDLFRPVLIDHPLNPEVRDVLDVYSDWFKESQ